MKKQTAKRQKSSFTPSDSCFEELIAAIIGQACKDYRVSIRRILKKHDDELALLMKEAVERFFHSAWIDAMSDLDGDALMKRLYEMEFFLWRKKFQAR